ncbi:MAG: hypothetical protein LBM98_11955 [Oscillospiraceae bacterium]|nr:hypothetical protein [Oscillospiraceae bacterium]
MRYVVRIGAKQSSAGGTTYGRIAGYYVNPGLLRRISLTTYRKCGGGFAKTGWATPSPVPAHCAGTVDAGRVRARQKRGNHPAAYGGTPPKRGIYGGGRV